MIEYLKKDRDYKRVYKRSKAFSNKYLTLFVRERKNSYRVGFTVTKKVGNAVTRNLIKRRLKAIHRENEFLIKPGYDYVFVAKKNADEASFQELKRCFIGLVKKL